MKIAVTAKGRDIDSQVDPRFGRAAFIQVIDLENGKVDVIDNAENMNAFKGAGIQAAVSVGDSGAQVLLTGYCGPNAFKTLDAAGVKVANDVAGTVSEAVNAFKSGRVVFAEGANVAAHW
jgi:predicted Fe-Mo cluster-binding NifX family protein